MRLATLFMVGWLGRFLSDDSMDCVVSEYDKHRIEGVRADISTTSGFGEFCYFPDGVFFRLRFLR